MDLKEIGRIFYRDGYRLADDHLKEQLNASNLRLAIKSLYEAVDGLLVAFVQRSEAEGKPVACKKGCNWCCHQTVFAVTHEILSLADHVAGDMPEDLRNSFIDRARQKSQLTLNKPVEEQLKIRAACPFLVNGACAVYMSRPMACRIYLSDSEPACRKEHDEPGNRKHIPGLFEFPLHAGRMLNEGFVAYLKQRGLSSAELPLEQGFASVATLEQSFESWIT